jgi:hypothetical protein
LTRGTVAVATLAVMVAVVVIIVIIVVSPLRHTAIVAHRAWEGGVPRFAFDLDDLVDLATVEPNAFARGADVHRHPRALDLP